MEICLIWAQDQNRVIGKDGGIPWHLPQDLKRFQQLTMGCPVIMGRKTWESLPKKPLPGRVNVVVSKTLRDPPVGVHVATDLEAALWAVDQTMHRVFVIGGAKLLEEAMPKADKLFVTYVHTPEDNGGDTFAPPIDFERFELATRFNVEGSNPPASFVTFDKKRFADMQC